MGEALGRRVLVAVEDPGNRIHRRAEYLTKETLMTTTRAPLDMKTRIAQEIRPSIDSGVPESEIQKRTGGQSPGKKLIGPTCRNP